MAAAYYSIAPVVEVPLDLDLLATQSDFYRALVDFHGADAINVLTYPIGSPFSKQCFLAVLQNLGSEEEFSATLDLFPIGELFKVALYLGSDTLLYHVVFDRLNAPTSVTLLGLTMDILGLDHYITDTVIQFIITITHDSRDKILSFMSNSRIALRRRIRNNIKSSGALVEGCTVFRKQTIPDKFVTSFKKPDVCLCCRLPITGLHTKNLSARLAPMGCCGMMVHLQCQVKFLTLPNLPNCPACKTTYRHGLICNDHRSLDSILTIHCLNNTQVHPLAYRIRNIVWPTSDKEYYKIHGPSLTGGGRPG